MKTIRFRVLTAALYLAMLCACAANNNAGQEGVDSSTPIVDTNNGNDTQKDDVTLVKGGLIVYEIAILLEAKVFWAALMKAKK